jgi:hypothetical protein
MVGEGIYETTGADTGRIKNPDVAHELANVEAPGQNARAAKEGELQRQAETGLSDDERKNIELMNGWKEKYPDAFEQVVDNKGRMVLEMSGVANNDYIFTQKGILELMNGSYKPTLSEYDATRIQDKVEEIGDKFGSNNSGWEAFDKSVVLKSEKSYSPGLISIRKMDLTSEIQRVSLHNQLRQAQAEGQRNKQNRNAAEANKTVDVKSLLSQI